MNVEICASTIRDVAVAMEGGADRVELCSVWPLGGLTPSVVVVQSAAAMGMPARALIRPREGHFVYSPSEQTWSLEEAKVMLDCGAEKVVVGALTEHGSLDLAYLDGMCEAVGPEALVWHRAIDVSLTPDEDVAHLLDRGVSSVLSSGGAARAVDGLERLSQWMQLGLNVIAGGGVRPVDAPKFASAGVEALHASCRLTEPQEKSPLFDTTIHPVDLQAVNKLCQSVHGDPTHD